MNKRIRELILQSVTFRLDPDSECYEAQVCPEDLEGLAELIVRECAQMLDEDSYMIPELGGYAHDIRKHFGVEE
jgi:hypothetical protein